MDKNKKEKEKKEKTEKMSKPDLFKFLRQNEGKYTLSELAEKTGWSWITLRTICTKNNIEIIDLNTKSERIIRANLHLDIEDMAQLLGLGIAGVRVHLKRMGIILPKETKYRPEVKETSTRTVKELKETDLLGPIAKSYQEISFVELSNRLKYGDNP